MAYNEFAYFYDEFNGEADYDALYAHIHAKLKEHGIHDGILADLGCGTGELTLMLTQAGYDMIGPAPELSSLLGTSVPKINNSDMKSYGFELEVNWRDRIGEVSYGAKFVLSDDQQKILRYPNDSYDVGSYYKGEHLNDIWGLTTIGIAKSQEEMDAHLAKVDQSSVGTNWGVGDIMYADLDGDGKISNGTNKLGDTGDYRIIGNSTPRFKYGITLDAAWKGFDFSIFMQGIGKRDLWLDGCYFWGANGQGNEWQSTGFAEHWDFFRPEGDPLGANLNSYYPRVNFSGDRNTKVQTRYLQNGAYLRLKNVQLGYTLPRVWTEKAGISSVRVYVSGDNLATITSLSKIFDPEATQNEFYQWLVDEDHASQKEDALRELWNKAQRQKNVKGMQKSYERLKKQEGIPTVPKERRIRPIHIWQSAAAILFLLLASSVYLSTVGTKAETDLLQQYIPIAKMRSLTLPDGTKVQLNSKSRSEERRVGKECSEPCRSRWSPYH